MGRIGREQFLSGEEGRAEMGGREEAMGSVKEEEE